MSAEHADFCGEPWRPLLRTEIATLPAWAAKTAITLKTCILMQDAGKQWRIALDMANK